MAKHSLYGFTNAEISQLFENVAAALTLKGENRFKIIAYQNASSAVEHATSEIKDLWEQGQLDDVPGFGQTIQDHIEELFTTGKVRYFDAAFKGIRPAVFELLKLSGVGPKTAQKIAETGVESIADLREKLAHGTLNNNLTPKTIENLTAAVEQLGKKEESPKRMLLPFATSVADKIIDYMKHCKAVSQIEPLGSVRRRVATIGDIDFAIASEAPKQVIDYFIKYPQIGQILSQGQNKSSVMLKIGVRVDVMVEEPKYFGSLLQHFTGSKHHNIHLRKIAKAKGLSLSEKGIKDVHDDDKFDYERTMQVASEEEFYQNLGMQWMPPEMREDVGEIEASIKHEIPELVALKDMKGDLHVHSSYNLEPAHDLGKDSMQDLIKNATNLGYEYLNLTDHNPSLGKHNKAEIIEILKKRTKHIESLKYSSSIKLLNSLEIDILPNGDLAVPVEGLKLLDLPICGVHSKHTMPRDEITKRVKTALENPYLKILVHPTNRLLNKRAESEIDWDVIFDTAKKHNKVLEINAFPDRLDLTDNLVREAISRGIKLVIDTDSHAVAHMHLMRYGVDVARRGWATKGDILNTWPWLEFAKFFKLEYK